jgi:hypothetical protein
LCYSLNQMHRHKNLGTGLLFLAILMLSNISFNLFLNNRAVYALTDAQIQQKALEDCAKNSGVSSKDYDVYKKSEAGKACIAAYVTIYKDASQATFDKVCTGKTGSSQAGCLIGRNLGKAARDADQPSGGGGGTTLTDAQIKAIANNDNACQVGSKELKNACIAGFLAGYKGQSDSVCDKNFNSQETNKCKDGYSAGVSAKTNGVTKANPLDPVEEAAKKVCKRYDTDATPRPDTANKTYFDICVNGYKAANSGKNQKEACEDGFVKDSDSQKACLVGFNGFRDNNDDTSACVANGGTSLEWLLCPLTLALGKSADKMNDFIENQLNFSTNQFLPDSGSNAGVYKAWTIIKNLATSILIIILLIMVFSQAIGNGIFEAYTIRKILPRIVFAVIAMQLSWEICIFFINVANHLGEGLAQLITAPFGGRDNLDLDSILNHLSNFWAGAANVGLGAALVAAAFLAISNPAGAILVAFTVILAVIVALATILFRNVIIIACVMLSPLALILWVIPSSAMKKYWNLWSDNFTRALLLFPVMVGIIYTGRIFAWIVGGLNGPGFIDFIMVIVGFFGPYYMLPQSFKWGGSLLSQGYGAISKGGNALGKKPKEYLSARKEEFGKERKRQSQERVAEGNPSFIKGDHFRSGNYDPMYLFGKTGTRLREAKLATYEAGGAHSFEEENKQFEQAIEAREKGLNERADTEWWYEGKDGGETRDAAKAKRDEENNPIRKRKYLSGDKDDLVQAIATNNNDLKFRMVDGRELTINDMFGKIEDAHVEAALGRMASLGGNPNLTALDNEVMGMMEGENKNNPDVQRRLNRFLGRSAGTMFGKMPHWYKGVGGAANGLNPEQLAGVSGASMRRMISSLEEATDKGDTKAGENLAALARTWGEAIKNPNTVNRIDKTAMSGMGQFLERMSKPDNNIKAKIVGSIEDPNLRVDTSKVLDVLKQRITPNGDVRDPEPEPPQVQQQETTTQTGTEPSQNTGSTGGGTTQQQTGGASSGGGATGQGAGGGTYTPTSPPQEFNYERNAQAIAQALKESDAFKIPHDTQTQHQPGQVISPTIKVEGPNIPVRETTESGLYVPQERRTRPGGDGNQ